MSRIAAVPAVLAALSIPNDMGRLVAAVVFAGAALTDVMDGYAARRAGISSRIGPSLDLFADKLLVAVVLVDLVARGDAPAVAALALVLRELAVTLLRHFAGHLGRTITPSRIGKAKTALADIAVFAAIVRLPGAGSLLVVAALLAWVGAWRYVLALAERPAGAGRPAGISGPSHRRRPPMTLSPAGEWQAARHRTNHVSAIIAFFSCQTLPCCRRSGSLVAVPQKGSGRVPKVGSGAAR
jgi:CDP-diacylglycerol--glycerol-3-phosphate 3-phosphatidyltransferase